MVRQCLALRLVERRGSTALVASFWPFARFEARDLPILSVTLGAISQAVRGCVNIVMPWGVGCVRVTRSIMSRRVRQNVTSVPMPVVRTAAAVPIAAIAATVADGPVTAVTAASTVATAPATVADGPVTAAATVTGKAVTTATTVATAPATIADGPVPAAAAATGTSG